MKKKAKKKTKYNSNYFPLLIFMAVIIRVLLSFMPGFQADLNTWYAWASRLVSLGFAKFYHPQIWTHYTPGYLYVLWVLETVKNIFNLTSPDILIQLFKLPNNLADILTAVLIYKLVVKKSPQLALLGSVLYLFNPALIFNSSVWGQADSFLTLLMLFSFYLLLEKNNLIFSALLSSLAFLVKPQAIFILPIIAVLLFKKHKLKGALKFGFVFLIVAFLLSLPFFPTNPIFGLPNLIVEMGKDYSYTTLGAFNFWRLFGIWQRDNTLFLGLTKHNIGLVIYLLIEAVIVASLWRDKEQKKEAFYLAAALSLFNFFLFPTRIHERYLLSTFPFLLIAGVTLKSLSLVVAYICLSLLHFINLFYVYSYYYPEFIKAPVFNNLTKLNGLPIVIGFLSIIIFITNFSFYLKYISKKVIKKKRQLDQFLSRGMKSLFYKKEAKLKGRVKETKPKIIKNAKTYLLILLIVNVVLRIFNVWHPQTYIFDEVYHGFTAQEMAKGNVKAWEWWNTPPEGFAYEWTHPPLAKLMMAAGILLFGQNNNISQYAYRFPGVIFSLGVIYLTYLLAFRIFKNEKIGLLAALIVSLDNMMFTMSRIGMADIYFLFFLLLTIYLTLKESYLWAGLSLGLAIASKWTGLYLYLVVGAILLSRAISLFKEKGLGIINHLVEWLITFVFLPAISYLLSYTLFFTSGHSFEKFLELQKQMWWYHTSLKATHNFQSQAWSWPFMAKPVWFWVDYQETKIANIYNFGNPLLWWSGFLILLYAFYKAISRYKQRESRQLSLIIFCYFSFWLPWLGSPRIMFLHHYLPAIPFLSILIAWFLESLKDLKFKVLNWKISGKKVSLFYLVLIIISFFFFYPISTGLFLPKKSLNFWFWFPSWK